jgi:hypothetical protein
MSVFTAYAALVLRWCSIKECVIQYQSDGRSAPEIAHTIGYFASVLYLRVHLSETDCFTDLLDGVTREYCDAFEHADSSYYTAGKSRPDFTRNTGFNWLPSDAVIDAPASGESDVDLQWRPLRFVHPMPKVLDVDLEPSILLSETSEGIDGTVHFPLSRFSSVSMTRFGNNFVKIIGTLLREPNMYVKDVPLS